MKKLLSLLVATVVLLLSCAPTEEPYLDGYDIVGEDLYPMEKIPFGDGEAEYAVLRSNYYFDKYDNRELTKIESLSELRAFQRKHKIYSTPFKSDVLSIESFNGYAKKLDEDFFEDKIILVIHIKSGSGTTRFYVSEIYTVNNTLTVGISAIPQAPNTPSTCDMASWHAVVEIDRALVQGITEFKAI